MNIKIAIADKDKTTREMLKMLILKVHNDCTVYTAENGTQMCELIKTNSPDIIITDMIMPVCDGMEVIRFVRKHCTNAPAIIAVSESEDEQYIDECFDAGADYYAEKPVDAKELENLIRFIVSVRKGFSVC